MESINLGNLGSTKKIPDFSEILKRNYLSLIERLKHMRINYLKAKKDINCNNYFDFFLIWLKKLNQLKQEEYMKIIEDCSGDRYINLRTLKVLNYEDVLLQNPFKLDDSAWKFIKFYDEFAGNFTQLNDNEKDLVLKCIVSLILGNFEDVKLVEFIKERKLMAILTIPLSKNLNFYFSLYFENLLIKDSNCFEVMRFFGTYENNLEFYNYLENFKKEFLANNEIYPNIQFDKIGIKDNLNYEIFFYTNKAVLRNKKEVFLKLPYSSITPVNKLAVKKIKLFSNKFSSNEIEINQNYDFKDFILSSKNEKVFSEISNYHLNKHEKVLQFIKTEELQIALSAQEKCLIMERDNVIISGRSGTGKTTIIIFKILFSFLNFYLFKSHTDFKDVTWRDIFIPAELVKEKLKMVFTTYSDSLCFKVEELYSQLFNELCKKLNINYKYTITNNSNYVKNLNSFREIGKYPLFLNFRKILFMIDGTINTQFFSRQINNKMAKTEEDCDVEFKDLCEYKLNNYFIPNEFNFTIKTFFLRSPTLKNEIPINKIEVGEKDFEQLFYKSKVISSSLFNKIKNFNLNPYLVYAQIFSIIKGSVNSHLSYMNCISLDEYLEMGEKFVDLNKEVREIIYEIFIEYEYWKRDNNYFDLQDLVNHLIREVKIEMHYEKEIKLIDYLFIDEIQDLSINQIYLLSLTTRYPLVYAGDTCQTVSKSIRFRFTELFQIFHSFTEIIPDYQKPLHAPLNHNFRFGSNILRMSNFISNLISELFPNSIDRFNTEYANNKTNFIPTYLKSINSLIGNVQTNPDVQFTFFLLAPHHCFICRNKEKADDLRYKHQNILTHSIPKCKGLEWEVVVIYNFFNDSKVKKQWLEILTSISIVEKINENLDMIKKNLRINKKTEEDIEIIVREYENILVPKLEKNYNSQAIFEFCTELKELYVAITRARTFLIFYDEDTEIFPIFYKHISKIGLLIEDTEDNLIHKINHYLIDNNFKLNKEFIENEGNRYFSLKHYSIALYYYSMVNKVKAFLAKAYDMYNTVIELERVKSENYTHYTKLNEEIIEILDEIKSTDDLYGLCLVNLNKSKEALEFYEKKKNFMRCAKICMEKLKDFEKAAEYYDKLDEISLAIDALSSGKLYSKLFEYIKERKDNLDFYNVVSLYKKFSHFYLIPILFKTELKIFKVKNYEIESYITKIKSKVGIFLNLENYKIEEINNYYAREFYQPEKLNLIINRDDKFTIYSYKPDLNDKISLLKINNKNNQFIINSISPEKILFYDENNPENNIINSYSGSQIFYKKCLKLLDFIYNYVSILKEKIISKPELSYLLSDIYLFLNPALKSDLIRNEFRASPQHIKIIFKTLSGFDKSEALINLYSIYYTRDIKALSKEIMKNTQFSLYRFKKENSPEYTFQMNKNLLKENKIKVFEFIIQNKETLTNNSHMNINQLMRIIKQLNLNQYEIYQLLRKLLFVNGYFESFITLSSFPLNLYMASVISNFKLFNRLNNKESQTIRPNLSYQLDEPYIFSSLIRINLCKIFYYLHKYRKLDEGYEDYEIKENIINKIKYCASNLSRFEKIYSILAEALLLYEIKLPINIYKGPPIIIFIKQFRKFLKNPKIISNKIEVLELIEIGSTLSLFFNFYGSKCFNFSELVEFDNIENLNKTVLEYMEEIKKLLLDLLLFDTKFFIDNFNSEIKQEARLVYFSIFSIFNISTFPNENYFNRIYNNLPILIINTNSLLFSEEEFKYIAKQILISKFTKNFDSNGKNFVIEYGPIFKIIHHLIKIFTERLISLSYNNLFYPKEVWLNPLNIFETNKMITFYWTIYNKYFIDDVDYLGHNKFAFNTFNQYHNINHNKLVEKYFEPITYQYVFNEQFNSYNNIFNEKLNIELVLYLSLLPTVKHSYIDNKCSNFLESIIKTYYLSIRSQVNYLKEDSEYQTELIQFNLINFYYTYFLMVGCKKIWSFKPFTKFNEEVSNTHSSLYEIYILFLKEDFVNFSIKSIDFIYLNIDYFPRILLISWIKKHFYFIIVLIDYFFNADFKIKSEFIYYSENLLPEDKIYFNKIRDKLKRIDIDYYSHLFPRTIKYFFEIIEYVIEPKNLCNFPEEDSDLNVVNYTFKDLLELEVYKIYLTLKEYNFFCYPYPYGEYVTRIIKNFIKKYSENSIFKKEVYSNEIILEENTLVISLISQVKFRILKTDRIKLDKYEIILDQKNINNLNSQTNSDENENDLYNEKYLLSFNSLFNIMPNSQYFKKEKSYEFIFHNHNNTDEYINLIEELYEPNLN
jgi:hypothetical protein